MAVLAMITVPIVMGIIEDSKEQANRRSVDGLVRAGTYYLSESMLDPIKAEKIRNEENLINEISYEGKGPEEGQLYVNEHSDVALAVKYGNKCYKKEYTGNIISLDYNPVTCKLNINIKKPEITIIFDNVFNDQGWSNKNFNVTINTIDYSELGTSIKWCGTTNDTCTPSTEVSGTSQNVLISQESNNNRICAYAIDKGGHTGSTTCSDAYKMDKTAPIAGTLNISGTLGSNNWYTSDVSLVVNAGSDSLSGHATSTSNVDSITSNTMGTTVTVTTTDLAGNTSTRDYTIKVDKNAPTITTKSGVTTVDLGTSYAILDTYFTISNNGVSTISNTVCVDNSNNNVVVTNTSSLSVGNHIINCTVTKENGLQANLTVTITIKQPYTGVPNQTYNPGQVINYAGLSWKVISNTSNTVTLILANNYTTGMYGVSTTWMGSNAYSQVNTNFVNGNSIIKNDIAYGGIVYDNGSNSYVRLPYIGEVSSLISNNSGTHFGP